METISDSLFIGVFMLVAIGFVIPIASIGAALSFHLLRLPEYPPAYIASLARQNDPDHPTNLLARLFFGDPILQPRHGTHVWAASTNLFTLVLCNAFPVVSNIVENPYHTAGPLLRLFTLAFFACGGLWFWWFVRFVSRNRETRE